MVYIESRKIPNKINYLKSNRDGKFLLDFLFHLTPLCLTKCINSDTISSSEKNISNDTNCLCSMRKRCSMRYRDILKITQKRNTLCYGKYKK